MNSYASTGFFPCLLSFDWDSFDSLKYAIRSSVKKIVGGVRADTIVNHPGVIELRQRAGLAAVVIEFKGIDDSRLNYFDI